MAMTMVYPGNGYCQNYYSTSTASTQTIWRNWIATTTTPTITQVYSYGQQVWNAWNNATTTTYTITGQQAWQVWYASTPGVYEAPALTDEQRRRIEEQEAEHRARAEALKAERTAAQARARALLDCLLDPEQRAELLEHKRFHVRGSRGRRYCIRAAGQSGNVVLETEQGGEQGRFCIHPREYVPDEDAWLAQKLAIEDDEDAFLRTANVCSGSRPRELGQLPRVPVAA